jgi:hypothetical protein
MDVKEERISEIYKRVEALEALRQPWRNILRQRPLTISAAEMEYFSDSREERRLLLEESDRLLKS